jgi:hypothetical protein
LAINGRKLKEIIKEKGVYGVFKCARNLNEVE